MTDCRKDGCFGFMLHEITYFCLLGLIDALNRVLNNNTKKKNKTYASGAFDVIIV